MSTSAKNLKTRVMLKHDYEANWNDATGFIPMPGEVIIYDADIDAPTTPKNLRGTNRLPRVKIGDGKTLVGALPFVVNEIAQEEFNNKITSGHLIGIDNYTGVDYLEPVFKQNDIYIHEDERRIYQCVSSELVPATGAYHSVWRIIMDTLAVTEDGQGNITIVI